MDSEVRSFLNVLVVQVLTNYVEFWVVRLVTILVGIHCLGLLSLLSQYKKSSRFIRMRKGVS